MTAFQEIVSSIRRMKVDHDIPQSEWVAVWAAPARPEFEELQEAFKRMARLSEIRWPIPVDASGFRAITESGVEVVLEPPGEFDMGVEQERLRKSIEEATAEAERARKKLSNDSFTAKAPPEVVDKERAKLEEWTQKKEKLEAELANLS